MSTARELVAPLPRVFESAVLVDDADDCRDVVVARRLIVEQPLDFLARRGRHLPQCMNERQRHLVLAQIETRWLARRLLFFAVVEEIVGDLERHSQILTEAAVFVLVPAHPREGTELTRRPHQRRGLGPNEVVVLALGEWKR